VLNALRHQRFLHPESLCKAPRGRRCAQRLTASKVFARTPEPLIQRSVQPCSTPYGIKGFCTETIQAVFFSEKECSTPYGIKGFCTNHPRTTTVRRNGCSTPYGIKGFCTRSIATISLLMILCSTPYGIKGFCTIVAGDNL